MNVEIRDYLEKTQMTQNAQIYTHKNNNKFYNTLIINQLKFILLCNFCAICDCRAQAKYVRKLLKQFLNDIGNEDKSL